MLPRNVVEAQEKVGSKVDPVDAVQKCSENSMISRIHDLSSGQFEKCGVQHCQGEDNVGFVEGIVKYVWQTVRQDSQKN